MRHSTGELGKRALWALPLLAPLLISGIGALFSVAIVVIAIFTVKSAYAPTMTLVWRGWGPSLALGAAVGVATALGFALLVDPVLSAVTGEPVDLSSFAAVEGNLPNYLVLLAIGLLFGGIAEELVFRGFVIGWGAELFGKPMALPLAVVSACVFGLAHMYQGWTGVISTGLVGLIFGVLYVACGRRLLPAIMAHATNNFIGVTAIYLGIGL